MTQNKVFETEINKTLEDAVQIAQPIIFFTPKEIRNIMQENLKLRKASRHDLIIGKLLNEMPRRGIVHPTTVCNAIIGKGYFPVQWKVAQVIMIPKLGKQLEEANSYRPISLPPIMIKIFEKALLKRLRPILEENRIILDHQLDFDSNTLPSNSTQDYRDHARNFIKSSTVLRRS
jgi:hypothetical protein